MIEVRFDPSGEFCLTDEGRMDMLENLYRYRVRLEKSIKTIDTYNKSVSE